MAAMRDFGRGLGLEGEQLGFGKVLGFDRGRREAIAGEFAAHESESKEDRLKLVFCLMLRLNYRVSSSQSSEVELEFLIFRGFAEINEYFRESLLKNSQITIIRNIATRDLSPPAQNFVLRK